MYRRDHILNETQRLAQIIAKLLGLKNDTGKDEEIKQVYNNALKDEYNLEPEKLNTLSLVAFDEWLKQTKFTAPKLNTLAQLLYYNAEPFKANAATLLTLQKVLLLLDMLEKEHHMQLFENISKRQIIQQYILQHNA